MWAPALAASGSQLSLSGQEQQAIQKTYAELKAADDAGANVTILAGRFNAALELFQKAQALNRTGDGAKASLLASQANSSMLLLIPEAQELQQRAISQRQNGALEQVLIPLIEALVIAVVAVMLVSFRRWLESKQFNELRVRVKAA
jgi:hypothetical protein